MPKGYYFTVEYQPDPKGPWLACDNGTGRPTEITEDLDAMTCAENIWEANIPARVISHRPDGTAKVWYELPEKGSVAHAS